jgi:hypothetical protein
MTLEGWKAVSIDSERATGRGQCSRARRSSGLSVVINITIIGNSATAVLCLPKRGCEGSRFLDKK